MGLKQITLFSIFLSLFTVQNLFSISEASGITVNSFTGLYYVVGDEGYIYELNQHMEVLRTVHIGSFDLEAISFDPVRKTLFCLNEKDLSLIEIDLQSMDILNSFQLDLEKIKGRKYSQFESLVIVDGIFYFAVSTKEKKKYFGSLFSFDLEHLQLSHLRDLPLWDISGLTYGNGSFYIISDHLDKIGRFSLDSEELTLNNLPGEHQEGIVFTEKNTLYIFNENGTFFEVQAEFLGLSLNSNL